MNRDRFIELKGKTIARLRRKAIGTHGSQPVTIHYEYKGKVVARLRRKAIGTHEVSQLQFRDEIENGLAVFVFISQMSPWSVVKKMIGRRELKWHRTKIL